MSDISLFYNHEVQYILALFLTNRELYSEYSTYKDRQDYFFNCFRRFAANYYNFSEDESIYFASVRKEAAGEANICGGGGSRTGASARYFKTRYRIAEQTREKRIDQFAKKYGVSFVPGKDPRIFLGVTEIWNKLDDAEKIVAASKWSDATECAYFDETFETPFPKKVEKILVPLAIRNKTMQKIRNRRIVGSIVATKKIDEDDDLEPHQKMQKQTTTDFILTIPPEIYDGDW